MSQIKAKYITQVSKDGYRSLDSVTPNTQGPEHTTFTEIGEKQIQEALWDFVNLSESYDGYLKAPEIFEYPLITFENKVLQFCENWGTLFDTESGLDMILSEDRLFEDEPPFLNPAHYYHRSDWARTILKKHKQGHKKLARDLFLRKEGDTIPPQSTLFASYFQADFFFEDDPELTPVIEFKTLWDAITYGLWKALTDQRPIRKCPVCGMWFQKKITAVQCSDRCKSNKANKKRRSKK